MNNHINKEKILNYIKDNNLSKQEFCKRSNISPYSLNKMLNNKNISIVAIYNVSRQMKISIAEMFDNKKVIFEDLER